MPTEALLYYTVSRPAFISEDVTVDNGIFTNVMEIIDLAVRLRAGGNRDVLDLLPSRAVEQDVLDLIDEP